MNFVHFFNPGVGNFEGAKGMWDAGLGDEFSVVIGNNG